MILFVFISLMILMTIAWFIYLLIKNTSIIDCFWSLGFILSSSLYLAPDPTPIRISMLIMIIIWAIRLFAYIFTTRIVPKHIEQRYGSPESTSKLYLWLNFLFQGLLVFCLTLPLAWLATPNNIQLSLSFILLFSLLQLGCITGETLADIQLHQFRKQSKSLVCQKGLWQYSRHPNLFFDWLFWVLISIETMLATPLALLTPALLYVIMNHLTIPITERQSLKRKGQAFADYQKSTSKFFMWVRSS